jgi:hypothetical protein
MTLLHDAVENKKFDTRMVERNVTRGALTQKQVEDFVKSLPDDTENSEYVSIDSLIDEEGGNGNGHLPGTPEVTNY